MLLKDVIKDYKQKTGLNNENIAKLLNVSKSTVGRWLSGDINSLQSETKKRLSDILGNDIDQLLSNKGPLYKKPLLGYAKAGYDMYLENNIEDYIEVNTSDDKKGDYFLRVKGDSMELAHIHDGDLLFVKSVKEVRSGAIAVVRVGDEVTIKRVIYKPDLLILEAANPDVENRYFTQKEVKELPIEILGKVIYAKSEFE